MKPFGVVYLIVNRLNGKKYVGQTVQRLKRRFDKHAMSKRAIGVAIRKYGRENFTIEILEECDSSEQLNEREMFWIHELNTKSPNGYNLTDGGDGSLNPSAETRTKMSTAHLGKISNFRGHHHTAEARARMTAAHLGNNNCRGRLIKDETRAKISAAIRGESPYKKLIKEMDARQLTYSALAKLLNVTRSVVSRKMSSEKNFTARDKVTLEKFFCRPVEYLLEQKK